MTAATLSDAELVAQSLDGDQNAFGKVVERYQSLVCSLAYSATGSLSQSEDLAQETFVTAWKQLRKLREPDKLRSWLCGITRNLTRNWLRHQGREPSACGNPLEAAENSPSPGPFPQEETISKEEQAILWRSLERIPEIYREPLILFYRQHHSVQQVAVALELTEDVVRQRLSRGRKALNAEVTSFVEGALARSAPGRAFAVGVLAALPVLATSATAGTIGAAAVKGSAAAKTSALLGLSGAVIGPLIGVVGGWLGIKASLENATSEPERRLVIRMAWVVAAMVALSLLVMTTFVLFGARVFHARPVLAVSLIVGFWVAYVMSLFVLIWRFNRAQLRLRQEAAADAIDLTAGAGDASGHEFRSRWSFLGLPLVHIQAGRLGRQKSGPALGWIAIGDVAVGVLFAAGGVAVGGISMGGVAIGLVAFGGATLAVVAAGGLALGGWAVGGVAVGWYAFGGCAMAWQAAIGGFAVAKHYGLGGMGFAEVVNNEAAAEYIHSLRFYRIANGALRGGWVQSLIWLPMGLVIWQAIRTLKQRRSRKHCAKVES